MRRSLLLFGVVCIAAVFTSCAGGPSSSEASRDRSGYDVQGFTFTFVFSEKAYELETSPDRVRVVGDMNGWNTESDEWDLSDDDGDGVWTRDVNRDSVPSLTQFKYIVNEDEWQDPDKDWENVNVVTFPEGDTYNLVAIY